MTSLQTAIHEMLSLEWVGILLARLAVGLLFFLSGEAKLFQPAERLKMLETITKVGVPFPRATAVFVSAVEFVCGGMLIIGLLTPVACLMLAADMVVALATVNARNIHSTSAREWLTRFLYLPQVFYVVILVWLFFSGPGWLSVDAVLLGGVTG